MKRLVFLFALILGSNLCWGQDFQLYKKFAEEGHAKYQFELGQRYTIGWGCGNNDALACYWFKKAAENGMYEALNYLAANYAVGKGVPKNMEKAVELYELAAAHGNGEAYYHLGLCYSNGNGVDEDDYKAKECFELAVSHGYNEAKSVLESVNERIAKKDKEEQQLAAEQELAKQEEARAQAEKQMAEKILTELQGNNDAAVKLGNNYIKGNGVAKDYAKAVEQYKKAAAQGNKYAFYNLGLCFQYGVGTTKDLYKAKAYFERAETKGIIDAIDKIAEVSREMDGQKSGGVKPGSNASKGERVPELIPVHCPVCFNTGKCSNCNGTGISPNTHTTCGACGGRRICTTCNGTGIIGYDRY